MDQLNVHITAYAAIIRLSVDIKDSWTVPRGGTRASPLGQALVRGSQASNSCPSLSPLGPPGLSPKGRQWSNLQWAHHPPEESKGLRVTWIGEQSKALLVRSPVAQGVSDKTTNSKFLSYLEFCFHVNAGIKGWLK